MLQPSRSSTASESRRPKPNFRTLFCPRRAAVWSSDIYHIYSIDWLFCQKMADMVVVTVRVDNENKVIIIKSMWSNRYLSILMLVWLLAVMQTQSVVCNSSFPYDYNSACFQQCPWNDTQVTYLLNGTTQCNTSIICIMQPAPMEPSPTIPPRHALSVLITSFSMSHRAYTNILRSHLLAMCAKLLSRSPKVRKQSHLCLLVPFSDLRRCFAWNLCGELLTKHILYGIQYHAALCQQMLPQLLCQFNKILHCCC